MHNSLKPCAVCSAFRGPCHMQLFDVSGSFTLYIVILLILSTVTVPQKGVLQSGDHKHIYIWDLYLLAEWDENYDYWLLRQMLRKMRMRCEETDADTRLQIIPRKQTGDQHELRNRERTREIRKWGTKSWRKIATATEMKMTAATEMRIVMLLRRKDYRYQKIQMQRDK